MNQDHKSIVFALKSTNPDLDLFGSLFHSLVSKHFSQCINSGIFIYCTLFLNQLWFQSLIQIAKNKHCVPSVLRSHFANHLLAILLPTKLESLCHAHRCVIIFPHLFLMIVINFIISIAPLTIIQSLKWWLPSNLQDVGLTTNPTTTFSSVTEWIQKEERPLFHLQYVCCYYILFIVLLFFCCSWVNIKSFILA